SRSRHGLRHAGAAARHLGLSERPAHLRRHRQVPLVGAGLNVTGRGPPGPLFRCRGPGFMVIYTNPAIKCADALGPGKGEGRKAMGVGQVISDTFAIVKERVGPLLALWAVYFAITMIVF